MTSKDGFDQNAASNHFTAEKWAAILAGTEPLVTLDAAEDGSDEDLADLYSYACARWAQLDTQHTFQEEPASVLRQRLLEAATAALEEQDPAVGTRSPGSANPSRDR